MTLLPVQTKTLAALKTGASMIGLAPGTGKTRIAAEHAREIGAERALVVAPVIAVTGVWPAEIRRWRPEARVVLLRDLRAARTCRKALFLSSPRPTCSSLRPEARKIALGLEAQLLITDEATMFKSPDAHGPSRLRRAGAALRPGRSPCRARSS